MQAFMSGQIKVQGDMTKLMPWATRPPTAEQEAFSQQVLDLTEPDPPATNGMDTAPGRRSSSAAASAAWAARSRSPGPATG
jgi:hypothetical protein